MFIHTIYQNYDCLLLPNETHLNECGKPALPTKIIQIPLSENFQQLTIDNISSSTKNLDGTYNILPAQLPQKLNQDTNSWTPENKEIYNSLNLYPSNVVILRNIINDSNKSIAIIQINPIQYMPGAKKIILHENISFSIMYNFQDEKNVNVLKTYNSQNKQLDGSVEYLIITKNEWAADFQPIVEWKNKKGITTEIITLSSIYNNESYSGSNQEKIRAFIIEAYLNWGTKYVLIGGDTEIIPAFLKTFYISGDSFDVSSDTYYSDIDDDYQCEINLGRVPIKENDRDSIDIFIQKILDYEQNPQNADYITSFFGCGFDLKQYGSSEGQNLKENIKSYYLPDNWTYFEEYDSEPGTHKNDVLTLLNQGCHIVNHADHADKNYLGVGYKNHGDKISIDDVSTLTNGKNLSIMYSIGCSSAQLNEDISIGEAFVLNENGGCISYIGNSGVGWYVPYNPDAYSLRFDRYFFKSLFQDEKYILGECFSDHKNEAYLSSPINETAKMIFYGLVLLGDPELPIWTEIPKNITFVQYPEQIPTDQQLVNITVFSNQSHLPDARVCIQKGKEIYQIGYTNESGQLCFNLNPNTTGKINITVTKKNHIPYKCTMLVNNPPNAPITEDPKNKSKNVSIITNLSWSGSDPDNDMIHYDIYFGTNANPPIVANNLMNHTFTPDNLQFNTTYYWKIVVTDINNKSCIGPLWTFTTEYEPLPPKADFFFIPSRPVTNDTILFIDRSTDSDGYIVTWLWNFGDGNESTQQNTSYQYKINKTFYVNLTIVDDKGKTDSTTKEIVFNSPPNSNFYHNAIDVSTQDIIYFYDHSTDIDGDIVNWTWTFPDNNLKYSKNTSHQFDDNGNYTVTLRVRDNDNATDSYIENIIILNEPPLANFSYQPTNPTDGSTIFLNDESFDYDGTISEWHWKFGDGNTSDLQNPNHWYFDDGDYLINLTVLDDDGDQNTIHKTIQISNIAPIAHFSYNPPNPEVNQSILFTDSSTDSDGDIISCLWQFGDGEKSMKKHPTHSYSEFGKYNVTLNITDDDQSVNITYQELYINSPPNANYNVSAQHSFTNTALNFFDQSVDLDGTIIAWFWNFGDGTNSTNQSPTHQYSDDGLFQVVLEVTDERGANDTVRKNITINNTPPQANFSVIPDIAVLNQTISCTDNSIDSDGIIVNWTWDFGNNNTKYGENVTIMFANFSDHQINLEVRDDDNAVSTETKIVPMMDTYQRWIKQNNTIIDLLNKTGIQLYVMANYSILCNITSVTTNCLNEKSFGLSSIGPHYSIEVSNKSAIVWPMEIRIYYKEQNLENANCNEQQLIGLYFYNDSTKKWEQYPDSGVNTSYEKYGFQGYVWANVFQLSNISTFADTTAPSKVKDLSVLDTQDGSLDLSWSPSTDKQGIAYYRIYCNKKETLNTTGNVTHFRYQRLTNDVEYIFRVSAVDSFGNEGDLSSSVVGISTLKQSSTTSSNDNDISSNQSSGTLIAKAIVTPKDAQVFDYIYVNGSGSIGNKKIIDYHWSFGDGSSAENVTTVHQYQKAGIYQIVLTVQDEQGNTDENVTEVTIISLNHPPQNLTMSGPDKGHKNKSISFKLKAIDKDNDQLRFFIDWDDSTSTISDFVAQGRMLNVTHQWLNAGIYTISIIAEDEKNTSSKNIYETVYIDMDEINSTINGYLIDKNSDDIFDFFVPRDSNEKIMVSFQKKNNSYLIRMNENEQYNYNIETGICNLVIIDEEIMYHPNTIFLGFILMIIFILSTYLLVLGKLKK